MIYVCDQVQANQEVQANQAVEQYEHALKAYIPTRKAYEHALKAYILAREAYKKKETNYILRLKIEDGSNKINENNLKIEHLMFLPAIRDIHLKLMKQENELNKIADFMLKYLNKNTTYYLNNDIIINVTFNENINEELKNQIIQIIENKKL